MCAREALCGAKAQDGVGKARYRLGKQRQGMS